MIDLMKCNGLESSQSSAVECMQREIVNDMTKQYKGRPKSI
jgi:hypothetical protein